jgi:hypothetical protein
LFGTGESPNEEAEVKFFRKLRGGPVIVSACVLAVGVASVATGATGDVIRIGKRTAGSGSTAIVSNTGNYSTRQSNNRENDGGAASYGCRAAAGSESCLYVLNHRGGQVFRFVANGSANLGVIEARAGSGQSLEDIKPFTTNAHGVATGLNADEVDGQSADEIVAASKPLFAAVNAAGVATGGRGLAQSNAVQKTGEGAYTVTFSSNVAACAYSATETTVSNAGAVAVEPVANNANALNVVTRAGGGEDGTGASGRADRPFHLVVDC